MTNNNNGGAAPNKEIINQVKLTGIVRPRSLNDSDEIRFFTFQNGGGAIHIMVACTEPMPGGDANGQPRMKTVNVPVTVKTNKTIQPAQLQTVRAGMKVRIVGHLEPESYTSKKTGQKVTTLVVNAFIFEVLAMPQQMAVPQYAQGMPQQGVQQPYYAPQGGYPGLQQGAYPPAPQQQPYYPGMPAQGAPYGAPQGGYQAPYGGYPMQNGYPGPQQGQQQGQQAPAAGTPPYYMPPQGGAQASPADDGIGDIPV